MNLFTIFIEHILITHSHTHVLVAAISFNSIENTLSMLFTIKSYPKLGLTDFDHAYHGQ